MACTRICADGGAPGGAGMMDDGPLRSLQDDICSADAAHYTRGGARPLQYVAVLLLSLQYCRALQFLHLDPMSRELRVVAPALALALHSHSMSSLGGSGDLAVAAGSHGGSLDFVPAMVRPPVHHPVPVCVITDLRAAA